MSLRRCCPDLEVAGKQLFGVCHDAGEIVLACHQHYHEASQRIILWKAVLREIGKSLIEWKLADGIGDLTITAAVIEVAKMNEPSSSPWRLVTFARKFTQWTLEKLATESTADSFAEEGKTDSDPERSEELLERSRTLSDESRFIRDNAGIYLTTPEFPVTDFSGEASSGNGNMGPEESPVSDSWGQASSGNGNVGPDSVFDDPAIFFRLT